MNSKRPQQKKTAETNSKPSIRLADLTKRIEQLAYSKRIAKRSNKA